MELIKKSIIRTDLLKGIKIIDLGAICDCGNQCGAQCGVNKPIDDIGQIVSLPASRF